MTTRAINVANGVNLPSGYKKVGNAILRERDGRACLVDFDHHVQESVSQATIDAMMDAERSGSVDERTREYDRDVDPTPPGVPPAPPTEPSIKDEDKTLDPYPLE
ncbi:hypothetical protein [Pendulispora albinea]|uniref:Uncharacterized protein n=1 Tax=Pendulispora albinea TaxID=2741071 RepID=A0ABZ2LRA4_9BACT